MKRKSLPTGRDFLFVEGYGNENPGAFQSPRPLRGATTLNSLLALPNGFQPTRPLRGATYDDSCNGTWLLIFQPTRPLRGATSCPRCRCSRWDSISTHAPLAGRDQPACRVPPSRQHFNPRAPCGARQQKCTNHYAHFCDNRQISDVFAQNADCQGILFLFCARKTCKF